MPVPIRIVLLILCLAFFAYIVRLVSRKKLLLKYSLLWMALSVLLICCVIIPEPILGVASIMGIQVASNFIFIVAILCLLAISKHHSKQAGSLFKNACTRGCPLRKRN